MDNKQYKSPFDIADNLDKERVEALGREILLKMHNNPGMTLKDATGVSDEVLEELYSLGHTFYSQGKYHESIVIFEFLAGTSPSTYKYVLGLAASYHQLKCYQDAAVGFYIALNLEPENPIPAYYITDCFLKLELHVEAIEFAEVTQEICGNRAEYSELKQRCELIANSLRSK